MNLDWPLQRERPKGEEKEAGKRNTQAEAEEMNDSCLGTSLDKQKGDARRKAVEEKVSGHQNTTGTRCQAQQDQ